MPDIDRPLHPKGLRQCAALAETVPDVLKLIGGVCPKIWCSPSLRTRQTLTYGIPWTPSGYANSSEDFIQYPEWLYQAESQRLASELLTYSDEIPLMIIAHNNGLSNWAHELTGGLGAPLGNCHLVILRKDRVEDQGKFQITYRWEPPKFMD